MGCGYFADGDFSPAIESFQKAIQISADPVYAGAFKVGLGMSYLLNGQFQEAETPLEVSAAFCRDFGFEVWGAYSEMGLGVFLITKGHISQGFKILEECRQASIRNERRYFHARLECTLGKLYSQIAMGEGDIKPSVIARNVGFLIKNVPSAGKKAEAHFQSAIEIGKEIRGKGVVGQAYLDLGLLHKAKGRKDKARECISEALGIFKDCESEVLLKDARSALEDLG
jgi:tetratricopeptide (TPR) repeat protein